jgi:hypothetical protein
MSMPRTPEDVITTALLHKAISPSGATRPLASLVMAALRENGYAVIDTMHFSRDLEAAREALEGDSNDREHEALYNLTEILEGVFLR